jgi:hypothetical protein
MPSTLWTGTDYVCDVVARQTRHMKFRKIVDAVHHIRVLLNDVRQGLGIVDSWLDNFAMRSFTSASVFDDTLPLSDGVFDRGRFFIGNEFAPRRRHGGPAIPCPMDSACATLESPRQQQAHHRSASRLCATLPHAGVQQSAFSVRQFWGSEL